MPEAERRGWLRHAWTWVKPTDPVGHLQMPGSRVRTPGKPDAPRCDWANTRSNACPTGFNTEETIKELWGTRPQPIPRYERGQSLTRTSRRHLSEFVTRPTPPT